MMKFGRAFFLVLAISSSLSVSAQQSSALPAKSDYSKEAFVYEQITNKLVYENDGTATRDTSVKLRIQSDAGVQHWGLLRFSYQSSVETIDIPYIRVRKADGTAVPTPPDTFQDMAADVTREAPFYSDVREKHVAVKGLNVGDVIEYECISHLQKPLAPGQFWGSYTFTRDDVVLNEQLEIDVPRDRALKLKSATSPPSIAEHDKYRVYAWTSSNLKIEAKDDIRSATQQARGRFPAPDILFSSFQSWDEVGKWYGGLQTDRVKPSPEILAKAAELTKGAANDDVKIAAIYKYVSTEFRYIGIAFGIGRYQPHSAAEVLANQYGDCKDKHTLLASLLAAAGIKAYPALINSSHEIDPDVPSPGQFDHVIGAVYRGDKLLWLDSTPEVSPLGYLVGPLRDKPALLIADNKPATLITTPADAPFPQSENIKIVGKLSDNDVLDARFDRTERGDAEVLFRAVFRKVPETQWKDIAQGVSYASGFGGTVSDVAASSPTDIENPFHISYAYNRKDYGGDWANHRITPPIPMILLPGPKNEDETPKDPIWLGARHEIVSESRIELPRGFSPELPREINVTRDFAEYHSSYAFENGVFIAKISLVTTLKEVPVAEYDEYKAFRKWIEGDRDQYIQLSSIADSPVESPQIKISRAIWNLPASDDPDALRYESNARDALQRRDIQNAVRSLKEAVASDPKYVRAWILLGIVYDGMHRFDEALKAYRGAVAADPSRPLSYKMIGFLLISQRKYDESVKAWQEMIKVDPKDVDGPANLGSALFQLKRYSEAAAAYESATKLGPDTAELETRLGSAYILAGKQDAATASFNKALQLDTTPNSENDIAYEMAEAGTNLPLALDYAQKAVHTVEEHSQQVDIAILKTDDLKPTQQLGAYWDTLGWVYYKMGDLQSAENYLRAAWSLSLDAIAADHLGQIYEKQQKSDAARHMYHLALTANPRFEETKTRLGKLEGKVVTHPWDIPGAELSDLRTIKLPRFTPTNGSSEIFVLVSADKIQDVYFLSGDKIMKPTKSMFSPASFKAEFPSGSSAFLLRRGILSCFKITGCSLVVYPPDSVRSIN